jgi:predicted DNA-binding transcriptional regulator AlpA
MTGSAATHLGHQAALVGAALPDDETKLSSRQVKKRYGDVSDMTIWRWMNDKRVKFPRPISIQKRNYWRLGDLREFDARQAAATAA